MKKRTPFVFLFMPLAVLALQCGFYGQETGAGKPRLIL